MFRKLIDFSIELCVFCVPPALIMGLVVGGIWWETMPTNYDFKNGARLIVPLGAISVDKRDEGYGVVVQSGINVTVRNDSDEWRTLTVSYRKPNYGILDTHAFEDLAPRTTKTFGAESGRYEAMYVSVSDYAQKKRNAK